MKIKYIGDKSEMKNVYGYDFSWRAVVDIPESDTLAIRKLSNNSHFEVVESGNDEPKDEASVAHMPEIVEQEPVNISYGIFRTKADGEKYSKPDKVCDTEEEVDAYLKENGLTRDDRLVMKRGE